MGTVALTVTGMSREVARFQARSAFFGVGFTTGEAEAVVGHPVRRRIIMWLILLGNAGVVTTTGTLLISFAGGQDQLESVAVLLAGVVVLGALAMSRPVDRVLTRVIRRALRRWTDLDVRDYAGLLELGEGYAVAELEVEDGDWIAGRELGELTLRDAASSSSASIAGRRLRRCAGRHDHDLPGRRADGLRARGARRGARPRPGRDRLARPRWTSPAART